MLLYQHTQKERERNTLTRLWLEEKTEESGKNKTLLSAKLVDEQRIYMINNRKKISKRL